MTSERANVYETTTAAILRQLEAGTRPWAATWDKSGTNPFAPPVNHAGKEYRGVNVVILWAAAAERGFGTGFVKAWSAT